MLHALISSFSQNFCVYFILMLPKEEEEEKTLISNQEEKNVAEDGNENVDANVASASTQPLICSVCKTEFDSRNKLFEHIKLEGHAGIKKGAKAKTKKVKAKK